MTPSFDLWGFPGPERWTPTGSRSRPQRVLAKVHRRLEVEAERPPAPVSRGPRRGTARGLCALALALLALSLGLPPGAPAATDPRPARAGDLDPGFGRGGRVVTRFARFGFEESIQDLALQRDGRVVVVGDANRWAIARYRLDGSLDPSFGRGGKVGRGFFGYSGGADQVVIDKRGRIVVAGLAKGPGGHLLTVIRLRPDGSLDPGFGEGGVARPGVGPEYLSALVLQPDGKLVIAGTAATSRPVGFLLSRLERNGAVDRGFGQGGQARLRIGPPEASAARDVVVQPDGGIVTAGFVALRGRTRFALARHLADGAIDPSFGRGGKVLTRLGSRGEQSIANALAILARREARRRGRRWLPGGEIGLRRALATGPGPLPARRSA